MALFDAMKKALGKGNAEPQPAAASQPAARPAFEPPVIPEISAAELMQLRGSADAPRLLDCREPFEWAQVRIPGSLHIPMNDIPARLAELDRDAGWVVVCAHGNRSYSVAAYLLRQGLRASSLEGGVTDWWMHGGETESDLRR